MQQPTAKERQDESNSPILGIAMRLRDKDNQEDLQALQRGSYIHAFSCTPMQRRGKATCKGRGERDLHPPHLYLPNFLSLLFITNIL